MFCSGWVKAKMKPSPRINRVYQLLITSSNKTRNYSSEPNKIDYIYTIIIKTNKNNL